MLEILVTKYGIPENFYSDKHTILINPKEGELTNFGHMCEDLGINIIAANTPQAKGKVEKWNNTIQNRLINDIKRYNIKSVDELNIFFNNYYQILDKDNSIKQIYKGTEIQVFENVLTKVVRAKYYNIFYETKQIEGHRQDSIKREQMKIDNQKQLEQVLRERDERLKARESKVSS